MVQIPILVKDLPLTRLTNSVLVGTMKFTLDQFNLAFDADHPAPGKLGLQMADYAGAYNGLNEAYALTRESLITVDISALDHEGDQLYLAVKETAEAAQRMTYLPAKKQAGDRTMVFLKKYRLDVRENMVSEWSKMQQLCEEAAGSAAMATLGLTDVMARLTEIATLLRQKLTERSAQMPAQQAMKQAREAIYPEYRVLIQLLNAFALIDQNAERYNVLISALNANIDYVKIHAMSHGEEEEPAEDDEQDGGGSSDGGSSDGGEVTPVQPE